MNKSSAAALYGQMGGPRINAQVYAEKLCWFSAFSRTFVIVSFHVLWYDKIWILREWEIFQKTAAKWKHNRKYVEFSGITIILLPE